MTMQEDLEKEDMVDAFTKEVMEMGRQYQEAALRMAALRMYEIVYGPEKSKYVEKPLRNKRRSILRGKKSKPRNEGGSSQRKATDEMKLVIDLDPVTHEPIGISYLDEDDFERRDDNEYD